MKRKKEAGYSLIEVLVAITILAAVVLPTCSALLLGVQLNEKTDKLMRAQLAVSSAVETLMAEGISLEKDKNTGALIIPADYGNNGSVDRFPEVTITVEQVTEIDQNNKTVTLPYYNVTVASSEMTVTGDENGTNKEALVTVTTTVAADPTEPTETATEATDPGEEGTQ